MIEMPLRDCLDSRKWAEGTEEVLLLTSLFIQTQKKKNKKNLYSFSLFPFTQSFSHFQGDTGNFVVI